MNILSMLVRLEDALGRSNLSQQMVLLPPISPESGRSDSGLTWGKPREINLVVGYNGSPNSQTALDLTLWIAHQTRLATRHHVTVQVVYVVDLEEQYAQECAPECALEPLLPYVAPLAGGQAGDRAATLEPFHPAERWYEPNREPEWGMGAVAALPDLAEVATAGIPPVDQPVDHFDHADRILWQARQMADEWRGSLKTHLRFGNVAQELRRVVNAESASVLLLGCTSVENRVVEQLGLAFPCAVLGIPPTLD
jgi:nucleotide-binding universal stress UspA family protein